MPGAHRAEYWSGRDSFRRSTNKKFVTESSHSNIRDVMTPKLNDETEERLRPSRFLGYDRDHIGLFLLTKEMYAVAEGQFRRAAYLNPYEGSFTQHLAWALFKQGKYSEAERWIEESLRLKGDDDTRYIAQRIRTALEKGSDGGGVLP